jgi:hypothetical protein
VKITAPRCVEETRNGKESNRFIFKVRKNVCGNFGSILRRNVCGIVRDHRECDAILRVGAGSGRSACGKHDNRQYSWARPRSVEPARNQHGG